MRGIRPLAPYRVLISRAVLGYCLLFLAVRAGSGLLPSQLRQPVLTSFHYDLTMWVYKLSGLARLVAQERWSSQLFTVLLFLFGALSWCFPMHRRFIIPFSILFFLLSLNFNFYLTHNSHYLAGFFWLLFAFWPAGDGDFEALWDGLRYFTCWVYGVAFIWKIIHGAFFQWDAGLLSTKDNLAPYLYQNPGTVMAHIYYWFLGHPFWLNAGHKAVAVAEGFLLVGFFTKKHDLLLIALIVFIHISTYLFADVFFAELMVLGLTLVPVRIWRGLWLKTVPRSVHHLPAGRK